jgi:hypothetical protein
MRFISKPGGRDGCGCLGIPTSSIWLFFTLMYFFTEPGAFPLGKWEFVWRFLAGPINFAF